MRQVLPNFFGDEWHKWMQQYHGVTQYAGDYLLGGAAADLALFAVQSWFYHFDVPVAEFIPDEIVHLTGSFA